MSDIKDVLTFVKSRVPASYQACMNEVQELQINKLWQLSQGNITQEERREKLLAFYLQEIHLRNIHYDKISDTQLAMRLYNDIERFSVITDYLDNDDVEGININSWEDIRVKFHTGGEEKGEPFLSPEHAKTVIDKLLRQSGITIDEAIPMAEGSIGSDIRITAVMAPIVPSVAAYIRKLRHKNFSTEEYVNYNFASKQILDFLNLAAKRSVSILFIGKVNTGKTTVLKYLLDNLPNTTQTITIETGAREMDITKRNSEGRIVNNVVHMLTREHVNEEMNITQEKLIVKALRLNPDIVSVAEMRDIEAHAAVEGSNSGHTVFSTVHAGSFRGAHKRIANLSRKKYATDFHTALVSACEAYQLGIYIHTTEDGIRRIMNVSECFVDNDDKIHYNSLWEYQIHENIQNPDGSVTVKGEYVQVNNLSESLILQMQSNGATKKELAEFEVIAK